MAIDALAKLRQHLSLRFLTFGRVEQPSKNSLPLKDTSRALKISHDTRVAVLKALADETRLTIVETLLRESKAVSSCDIIPSCASRHALSQPAMSHHFTKLVDAGIIIETRQGTKKFYETNGPLLTAVGFNIELLSKQ